MIEYYPLIRQIHIWAISLSGFLFFLRAFFAIKGAIWPRSKAIRIIVYIIDIILLSAAFLLLAILPKEVFANGWLHIKIPLVIAYILSGFAAMSKKLKQKYRIGFLILSAILYISIIGIALSHNPYGWLNLN